MTANIAYKVVLVLLASIAFIGNALVCHVIVRLKTMKTSINYIILNLAIVDAITGLLAKQSPFILNSRGISDNILVFDSSNHTSIIADTICRVDDMALFQCFASNFDLNGLRTLQSYRVSSLKT